MRTPESLHCVMQHTYASPFLILDEWVSVSRCSLYMLFNPLARFPSSTNSAKMALSPRLWSLDIISIGASRVPWNSWVAALIDKCNPLVLPFARSPTWSMTHAINFLSDFWVFPVTGERAFNAERWAIVEFARSCCLLCSPHYPERKHRASQTKHEWLENLVCKPNAFTVFVMTILSVPG